METIPDSTKKTRASFKTSLENDPSGQSKPSPQSTESTEKVLLHVGETKVQENGLRQ